MRALSDYPKGVVRKWKRYKKRKHNDAVVKKYSGGEIYYVIRPNMENCGIATMIRSVLSHLYYAKEKGWTPVVDYQTYPNPYLDADQVGTCNAWDFFFEQPAGIGLDDVRSKENTYITEELQLAVCPTDSMEFYSNPYCVAYWRDLFHTYFRLTPEAKAHVDKIRTEVFGETPGRILGCILRGTDYVERREYNHPIQPKPEVVIEKAKQVMEEQQYDNLFLATEDERILAQFIEVFGDKVIYVQQQRYSAGTLYLTERAEFAADSGRKTEGYNYLAAIYLLGNCDGLIGGRCGMTTISYLISEGYDYEYLWNIGRYRTDDYCLPEEYL